MPSHDLDELLDLADDALDEGDFEAALEHCDEALIADPGNPDARERRALALGGLGDAEEAAFEWTGLIAAAPKEPRYLLGAANLLVRQHDDDEDALEEALELLERARRLVKRDADLMVELELLSGMARTQLGDPAGALAALERARAARPDDLEVQLELAIACFESARFAEASRTLDGLLAASPQLAEAHHLRGLILERAKDSAASAAFEKASALDPHGFPRPTRLSAEAFDAAVAQAIEQLPAHARAELGNVTIAVEDLPSDEDLDGGRLSPTMLGLFQGTPVTERKVTSDVDHQTARIFLFQKNLERFAKDRDELVEQIGITLLHEVGHLLGLDEDDLRDRGLD